MKKEATDFVCPFESFFNDIKWDGTPRLDKLALTVPIKNAVFNVNGNSLSTLLLWPQMFKKWVVSAVCCALGKRPNGVILVLISPNQGTFKTTWLNHLCPPLLSDYNYCGYIEPNLWEINTAKALAEKFIINIDDQLDGIYHLDFNKLKNLVHTPYVYSRKACRLDEKPLPRRANFVASGNLYRGFTHYINRFRLTFEIDGSINMEAAKAIDMNQVWAEAYTLYEEGAQCGFDNADEYIINCITETFCINP